MLINILPYYAVLWQVKRFILYYFNKIGFQIGYKIKIIAIYLR